MKYLDYVRELLSGKNPSKPESEKFNTVIGGLYSLRDKSPWPDPRKRKITKVIDVKDGWVRYSMGRLFPDNRMKEDNFHYCYILDNEP